MDLILPILFFSLCMAVFIGIQRRRFKGQRAEFSDEHLLWDGPANLFVGREGVGGWLYLTKQRLLFRPHAVNIQRSEVEIPLCEIEEAARRLTAGFIPNGLRVRVQSGEEKRFVVSNPKRWSREITNAKLLSLGEML